MQDQDHIGESTNAKPLSVSSLLHLRMRPDREKGRMPQLGLRGQNCSTAGKAAKHFGRQASTLPFPSAPSSAPGTLLPPRGDRDRLCI